MKKTILITLMAAFALSSCKKDTLEVSSVTTYPIFELKGAIASTILVGGTYSESGLVAREGTTDISGSVITEGTVNPAIPGVYTLKYTAINSDGFKASTRRYVGVITPAAAAMDISGTYKRNAGVFGIVTVAKTSFPGLYINNNPGGADVDDVNIYMFQTEPQVVSAPAQDSRLGEFACKNGIYDPTGPLFKWACVNADYGTSVRTFIKQ